MPERRVRCTCPQFCIRQRDGGRQGKLWKRIELELHHREIASWSSSKRRVTSSSSRAQSIERIGSPPTPTHESSQSNEQDKRLKDTKLFKAMSDQEKFNYLADLIEVQSEDIKSHKRKIDALEEINKYGERKVINLDEDDDGNKEVQDSEEETFTVKKAKKKQKPNNVIDLDIY